MENGINGINKSVRYLYTRSYDILKFNDLIRLLQIEAYIETALSKKKLNFLK